MLETVRSVVRRLYTSRIVSFNAIIIFIIINIIVVVVVVIIIIYTLLQLDLFGDTSIITEFYTIPH